MPGITWHAPHRAPDGYTALAAVTASTPLDGAGSSQPQPVKVVGASTAKETSPDSAPAIGERRQGIGLLGRVRRATAYPTALWPGATSRRPSSSICSRLTFRGRVIGVPGTSTNAAAVSCARC